MDIKTIVSRQRDYFQSGVSRPLAFRLDALRKLQKAVKENEDLINEALKADLNKPPFETFMTETGQVLDEIRFHLKNLPHWMKTRKVRTHIAHFHAQSFLVPEPYGVTLIMSPWNYPILLCLTPVIGAISGGNCAVIKPSVSAPETNRIINKIISSTFSPEYLTVVEGGRDQNSALLKTVFDYIFFTGSSKVGKMVMEAASKNLTPLTLELGGKNPVIVDKTANIRLAAKRIAFGKVLNGGQSCLGPDYLYIHHSVRDQFLQEFKKALEGFFPGGDMTDLPKIINKKHYNRIKGLIEKETVVIGGGTDDERYFIEPTVLIDVSPESAVMQKEVFGPVLPVMTYSELDECINFISSRPKPLALYLFTEDKKVQNRVLDCCSFGGGCINDTIVHIVTHTMGYGGVGESGMGSHHGKQSFDTFTHYRSILKKYTWLDTPMRYHPYTERNLKILRKLFR